MNKEMLHFNVPPKFLSKLHDYVLTGGPSEGEWRIFNDYLEVLALEIKNKEIQAGEVRDLRQYLLDAFDANCMQGFALSKPHGYAGDYEIIDRIYTGYISNSPHYTNWDKYFQNNSAPKAVRNRKDYFKTLVRSKATKKLSILNVASGPCRDIFEVLEENPLLDLQIDCVEMDANAIRYAEELTNKHSVKINFINKNIFKFESKVKYDLIWSAGLFDYFDDKSFVFVLKRFLLWCADSGEIVIGNFSVNNPSRNYMEIFGEWFLHHRSLDNLTSLAQKAGIGSENIFIGEEEEGVNLFLHIKL